MTTELDPTHPTQKLAQRLATMLVGLDLRGRETGLAMLRESSPKMAELVVQQLAEMRDAASPSSWEDVLQAALAMRVPGVILQKGARFVFVPYPDPDEHKHITVPYRLTGCWVAPYVPRPKSDMDNSKFLELILGPEKAAGLSRRYGV